MKYMIIAEISAYDLQKQVNIFIEEGWKPQGGVSWCAVSVGFSEKGQFMQAMIMEE